MAYFSQNLRKKRQAVRLTHDSRRIHKRIRKITARNSANRIDKYESGKQRILHVVNWKQKLLHVFCRGLQRRLYVG